MNRRKLTKGISFEPKIPTAKIEEKEEIVEKPTVLKGNYAPLSFSEPRDFNLQNFLLKIPPSLSDSKLVEYEDGSIELVCDGKVYECNSSFLDNSIVVNITDKVQKVSKVDHQITVFDIEK